MPSIYYEANRIFVSGGAADPNNMNDIHNFAKFLGCQVVPLGVKLRRTEPVLGHVVSEKVAIGLLTPQSGQS